MTITTKERTLTAIDYRPPRWLRNRHVQSYLGMSQRRQRHGERCLAATGAVTQEHLLQAGDGIILHGLHSSVPGGHSKGFVVLLHGWEGSAKSSYMVMTAARLLEQGFDVFRLHFRDHGESHHLNCEPFHLNRIDELVAATCDLAKRFQGQPMAVVGFSLGGNFALRLAMHAPAAGLSLAHVVAVCPALDPARVVDALEAAGPYHWWFRHRWGLSLLRKRELFPEHYDFDDSTLKKKVSDLIQWLVDRYTDFDTLEQYFDGYTIAGTRLSGLQVPASILMAADDPMIPVDDFHALELPDTAKVEITPWGGHCGFVENARLDGFAERWIVQRLVGEMG